MKPSITSSTDRPLEASAEFRVGVHSAPYLADHGLHDMVVLPGSFYIDRALRLYRERFKRVAGRVRNVTFHNPIILSAEETLVRVDVRDRGDGRVAYTFYEAGTDHGRDGPAGRRPAAMLEIDQSSSTVPDPDTDTFSIEAFQAKSHAVIDPDRFYRKLRENGNQYGPAFQNVRSIWRAGDQSLGRLSVARAGVAIGSHDLHPSLLDAATQLLAPFIMEKGKTFLLRSIDRLDVTDADLPGSLWGHAVLLQGGDRDGQSLVGSVRVFDGAGEPYLTLSGIAFAVLDDDDAAAGARVPTLAIAANFTAEPVEDSLRFWRHHFALPIHVEFAPFGQVFQQLLDTESLFRKNRDGVNVILLALEEWAPADRHRGMKLSTERAGRCFANHPRYVLPNSLEIVHLNRYETDYVYKEIFEDQCYLKHGIRLPDGAMVVDIGANIGLFSLFVMSRCRNPEIYAFEPAPVVFELLKANCEAYGANVHALNVGVSHKPGTAALTFYEKSSVFSGFHADEAIDREAIRTVVRNTLSRETSLDHDAMEGYVTEFMADRLRHMTLECRVTSVSEIIREHGIDRIDLLKIDAEKSELAIIEGIEDDDWPKIDQIVIEIHDRTGEAVKRIEGLLIEKGYRCAVDQERLLEHTGLFNLYATRREGARATRTHPNGVVAVGREPSRPHPIADGLQRTIQDFCAALRSFMARTTAPLVLCLCPRRPAGEGDAALTALLNEAETALLSAAGTIPNVHAIGSASSLERYPVTLYYDTNSHQMGHIPYTPECYAAIGTAVFRTVCAVKRRPFKVVALDCDNTLWRGVCGEDGPLGVDVSPPYRALQEFLVGQVNAGMLLCLCSKNHEGDVLDVFRQRTDMVLKREHLAAWRINWTSKADNLKSLARELNLGLDSFIFIDDSPVECADVRVNCPDVLTLQLPSDSASFPAFLNHLWAFDREGSTEEDRHRTRLYQENTARERFRQQIPSLKTFIEGLQLRLEMAEVTDDQLGRVSQLTFRTNQFNFTTIRRSAGEIREFLTRDGAACLTVRVVDRFGDYGLVGVVMYETEADRYKVDTFLLSCRVLGRGVEYAILAEVGQRALRDDKPFVQLTYHPTDKNAPVAEFLQRLGDRYRNEAGTFWTIPAERLAALEYDPDDTPQRGQEPPAADGPEPVEPRSPAGWGAVDRLEPLQRIAESLADIDRLVRAIEDYRLPHQTPAMAIDVATQATLDTALLTVWRKVLGRSAIGMHDNFFEVGGTSLKAVQVIAMIKRELKQDLSIVSLFECPTVALLAARLSAASGEVRPGPDAAAAALRGRQRRRHVIRRAGS